MRPGWWAANSWAIAVPLSFATRSTWSSPSAIAEGVEHGGLGRERDVLVLGRPRVAVGQQIHRDAAADVGDALGDVAPEMAVQEDAVDEQGGGTAAPFAIGDVSEGRGYVHCVSPSFLGWAAAGC